MYPWTDQTRAKIGSVRVHTAAAHTTCELSSAVPTTACLQGSAQRLFNFHQRKQEWPAPAPILAILWLPVPHKSLCWWRCGFKRPEGTLMIIWSDFLPGTGPLIPHAAISLQSTRTCNSTRRYFRRRSNLDLITPSDLPHSFLSYFQWLITPTVSYFQRELLLLILFFFSVGTLSYLPTQIFLDTNYITPQNVLTWDKLFACLANQNRDSWIQRTAAAVVLQRVFDYRDLKRKVNSSARGKHRASSLTSFSSFHSSHPLVRPGDLG